VRTLAGGDLVVSRSGAVLEVRLNRPAKRNAVTSAMVDALAAVVASAPEEGVTVLVLRGEGGTFCAGADIAAYSDAAADPAALASFTRRARALCTALENAPLVVVVVVEGLALGGGFELVLAADIVVAAEGARFGLPETRLGLIPGWGGTQRLARSIGPAAARFAILTAAVLPAERLATAGLVSVLVPAGDLDAAVGDLVAQLASSAPRAQRAAKEAIALGADEHLGDSPGAERETEHLLALFASADGLEGVAAFTEKRAPVFTGH